MIDSEVVRAIPGAWRRYHESALGALIESDRAFVARFGLPEELDPFPVSFRTEQHFLEPAPEPWRDKNVFAESDGGTLFVVQQQPQYCVLEIAATREPTYMNKDLVSLLQSHAALHVASARLPTISPEERERIFTTAVNAIDPAALVEGRWWSNVAEEISYGIF